MSLILIIIASILAVALIYLTVRIRSGYQLSLTSVEEKSAGLLFHYHSRIHEAVTGQFNREAVECLVHYICLHIVVPMVGFGFFLRTDANFIVLLVSVIFSAQLIQKVYPGLPEEEDSASGTS